MRTSLAFATALVTLSVGCGHEGMDMGDHGALLDQHLGAAEADLRDHGGAIERAETLDEVPAGEEAHDRQMADHASFMAREMDDMMGCTNGEHPELEGMWDLMDLMGRAQTGHVAAMTAATSLAAARAEETRYQRQMSGLMGQMREDLTSMMEGAGAMSCQHHR